ncbi:hypothetical protein AgCh_022106 [Apium graveolens]
MIGDTPYIEESEPIPFFFIILLKLVWALLFKISSTSYNFTYKFCVLTSQLVSFLFIQAEHGPDSQVVLVIAGDGMDISAVEVEIDKQCKNLPRGQFASKALSHNFIVFARDMVQAITFSNIYAPEHLIINVRDAEKWESFIENAGQWTPESVGDYASGTNHVLPTSGYARMYGGVSLDSFLKYITVQSLTEEGLRKLGPYHVAVMAQVEGLEAHKRAVTLRIQDIEVPQLSSRR